MRYTRIFRMQINYRDIGSTVGNPFKQYSWGMEGISCISAIFGSVLLAVRVAYLDP